jgi:hypothetical protein
LQLADVEFVLPLLQAASQMLDPGFELSDAIRVSHLPSPLYIVCVTYNIGQVHSFR